MSSNRERVTQYLSEHPGVSVRSAARDLGVSYSTVSRVRATPATPRTATPATPEPDIPEGWASASVHGDFVHRLQRYTSALVEFDAAGRPWKVQPGLHAWDGDGLVPLEFDNDGEARVTIGSDVYTITRRKARPRRSVQQRA